MMSLGEQPHIVKRALSQTVSNTGSPVFAERHAPVLPLQLPFSLAFFFVFPGVYLFIF